MFLEASRRESIQLALENSILLSSSLSVLALPKVAFAFNDDGVAPSLPSEIVLVRGKLSLAPSVDLKDASGSASLYITCRPDKPDNVPAAILNGSRGKPPPVLSARIPNPTFPLDFVLTVPRDLTLEGAWDGKSHLSPENTPIRLPTTTDELWWNQVDLVVSARWDSDGVAATRSPEDLVGRGIWKFDKLMEGSDVEIQLSGRGAFGKFATATNGGSSIK